MAPVAVFAMFAVTVGTLRVAEAGGLVVYLSLFLIVCAILAMVVVPVIITSLVPARYRDVIYDLRNGLTLALVTTLSVVALPYIQQATEKLAKANGLEGDEKKRNNRDLFGGQLSLGPTGQLLCLFLHPLRGLLHPHRFKPR